MKHSALDLKQMGRNIRELRHRRGLTQTELARKAGCSAQHLSRLENGTGGMSVEVFWGLCRALACKPSEILEGVE